MMGILGEILAHKQTEIAALDAAALRREALAAPAPRDFAAAVTRNETRPFPRLIAEVKLASPSKGLLAPQLDVRKIAQTYAENGASAISVLTDGKYFLGKLETLRELRFTSPAPLPLLRKDFIINESQLYESRANGADAVLLIAAAVDQARLADLHSLALDLGLTPLVEVHNEHEVEMALALRSLRLVGINNRDLTTFHTSLKTTERVRPVIPVGIPVISESGITSAQDVERLARANVDAVMVGEGLVTAPDIAAKVRELSGMYWKSHDQNKDLRY